MKFSLKREGEGKSVSSSFTNSTKKTSTSVIIAVTYSNNRGEMKQIFFIVSQLSLAIFFLKSIASININKQKVILFPESEFFVNHQLSSEICLFRPLLKAKASDSRGTQVDVGGSADDTKYSTTKDILVFGMIVGQPKKSISSK